MLIATRAPQLLRRVLGSWQHLQYSQQLQYWQHYQHTCELSGILFYLELTQPSAVYCFFLLDNVAGNTSNTNLVAHDTKLLSPLNAQTSQDAANTEHNLVWTGVSYAALFSAMLETAAATTDGNKKLAIYPSTELSLNDLSALEMATQKATRTARAKGLTLALKSPLSTLPPQLLLPPAVACHRMQEAYELCEMAALYAYRFLKAETTVEQVETECTHYLSIKTACKAPIRVRLQSIPLNPQQTPATPAQTICDPSMNTLFVHLQWQGSTVTFVKTVAVTAGAVPVKFCKRYQQFQATLSGFLQTRTNQEQYLSHKSPISFFSQLLSSPSAAFQPLNTEQFQTFYTAAHPDCMNLLIYENKQHLSGVICESLLISKTPIAKRRGSKKFAAAGQAANSHATLHFEQTPPYHNALLRFF